MEGLETGYGLIEIETNENGAMTRERTRARGLTPAYTGDTDWRDSRDLRGGEEKMNGLAIGSVLVREEHVPRFNEMGVPVQTLGRVVGGEVVEFPAGTNFEDDLPLVDSDPRDRRFAEMAERHARFMFRVAYGLLRSVHDAEDAVQEALLKLYRGDRWMRMEDERAFLARTVWNAGLDVVARRQKTTDQIDLAAERELVWDGRSPEQDALDGDDRALLRWLIDGLPEDLRLTLVLSAVEEMTSREVAAVMGIPEGTVRTRVMRAKAELKRRFEAMRVQGRRATTDLHG